MLQNRSYHTDWIFKRLIERVHLVTAVKTTRLKTGQYKLHIVLLCPYIIIFVLMVKKNKRMAFARFLMITFFSCVLEIFI